MKLLVRGARWAAWLFGLAVFGFAIYAHWVAYPLLLIPVIFFVTDGYNQAFKPGARQDVEELVEAVKRGPPL